VQKLYELNEPADEFGNFVKVVLRLMEVEYLSVPVDASKDTAIVQKSLTGKFPMLELPDKSCISESLSIARYIS
jgi:glutathione S-transferase